ncbi:MAG: YkgJ family cysteine cluster protein [Candidatus Oxydemutatoraceae bacterium WSBS_2016_MAG_OTU14]
MTQLGNIPVKVKGVKMTSENKCGFCFGSKCCHYVTQQIDTPRSKLDFEHLLWQVSHDRINLYQDDEGWYLLFETSCSNLRADGGCGIYEARPQICRDHSNDFCEYDQPAEEGFKLHFQTYESLLKYCKKRFKTWTRG